MEYRILLQKENIILGESKNDYIVGIGYDETQPIGQQWNYGHYFSHDANGLSYAVDTFRDMTEDSYISRDRLVELATKFKDCLIGDEDITEVISDMIENEIDFFNLEDLLNIDETLMVNGFLFTNDELYTLSEGMLALIENANKACQLVYDVDSIDSLRVAINKYKELNNKLCNINVEL